MINSNIRLVFRKREPKSGCVVKAGELPVARGRDENGLPEVVLQDLYLVVQEFEAVLEMRRDLKVILLCQWTKTLTRI
jgi:hypothetical protein